MSYFISNKTATSQTGSIILDQGMSVSLHQQAQIEPIYETLWLYYKVGRRKNSKQTTRHITALPSNFPVTQAVTVYAQHDHETYKYQ
jgi:hypothetical protein